MEATYTSIKHHERFFEIRPVIEQTQVIVVPKKKQDTSKIEYPCKLFLDQSTKTGYAIYDKRRKLIKAGNIDKKYNAGLLGYRKDLKDLLTDIINEYQVNEVRYEETYHEANMVTTEVLITIKTMIKDMIYERQLLYEGEPDKQIDGMGVDHRLWKKELAKPKKFNGGKGGDKAEVQKYVNNRYAMFPHMSEKDQLTEDMYDAIGMGIALCVKRDLTNDTYQLARYEKNLPYDSSVHKPNPEDEKAGKEPEWQEVVGGLRKNLRTAYELGGHMTLQLDRRKNYPEQIRQILTHRDCLLVVKIPKDYRYWGLILLEYGIAPKELGEQQDIYLLCARKKRK